MDFCLKDLSDILVSTDKRVNQSFASHLLAKKAKYNWLENFKTPKKISKYKNINTYKFINKKNSISVIRDEGFSHIAAKNREKNAIVFINGKFNPELSDFPEDVLISYSSSNTSNEALSSYMKNWQDFVEKVPAQNFFAYLSFILPRNLGTY